MSLTTVENALLMPFSGTMDAFESGVFQNGLPLEGCLIHRGRPATPQPPEERLAGEYIFGGYLFGHFGHFAVESLSRVYAIRQAPAGLPILFISPNDQIFNFQASFFKLLGLRNPIILVQKPTLAEKLLYSQPGCSLNPLFINDEQIAALACHKIQPAPDKKKIWLSRTGLFRGFLLNEPEIEKTLAAQGWEIIRVEDRPPLEQIKLVNCADYVAGFDGSAFYLSFFSQSTKGKFLVFGRRSPIAPEIPYLLSRKGIPTECFELPLSYVDGEGNNTRFTLDNPDALLAILAEKAV